ncbi:short-chain dehydrogenase [Candidatus Caldipriscus sp.]|nr:short-chain dehydrogenase [Candidatus Caldipriscus sp.]
MFRKVLIVGGTGLVGRAVLRKIYQKSRKVFIVGLRRDEVEETLKEFGKIKRGRDDVLGEYLYAGKVFGFWGDIFLTLSLKDKPRGEILEDENLRLKAIEENLGFSDVRENFLYNLLVRLKPEIVIDTVNTATAVAYRDQFSAVEDVYKYISLGDGNYETLKEKVEKLLLSLYTPLLIRHFFVLREGLKRAGTRLYLKVGTTGTGGMGWDIPYTHGEERPSRVLLSKTAMAGASSLLYVILSRANDSPIIKEIKPAAAIGWKKMGVGEIIKGGIPIKIKKPQKVKLSDGGIPILKCDETGEILKTAFIDTGENGLFSLEEFRSITSLGQMGMITAEDIAEVVMLEIEGKGTGKDVVGAIESALLGPSYRGGVMVKDAIRYLEELSEETEFPSVAFEILGPPRLSKLLFEAYILSQTFRTYDELANSEPSEISERMWSYISENEKILNYITSIGLGVLSPDLELYYTENLKVPKLPVENFKERDIRLWAKEGWVDTTYENAKLWRNRAIMILESIEDKRRRILKDMASSVEDREGLDPSSLKADLRIIPGYCASFVFINEDKGKRSRPY